MDYLIDTNVLLRALAVRNPLRPVARQTIKALLQKGAGLCVAPQNLVELWNVCTRQHAGLRPFQKYRSDQPGSDAIASAMGDLSGRFCFPPTAYF